ncbi:putative esterase D14L [Apostasia shenzhenica]|uniref:Putative esterase D14L n=1 Tax=Apostasia shenzhenica TaxID=1088818 RepID=A0A2I0B4V2_9ASPA|nr:putative esterase D14L [Apostasia shenzhenica]
MASMSSASPSMPLSVFSSASSPSLRLSEAGILLVKCYCRTDFRCSISFKTSPTLPVDRRRYVCARSHSDEASTVPIFLEPDVHTSMWNWRGYSIRYQYAGNNGPALVLIHGFGANSDHWRKNVTFLARTTRVYSVDLIGYGYSEKPNPRDFGVNSFYTFETWATQINEFCSDVIKGEAFFVCNSIGGVVGLQAAITEPQICKGLILLNISLRMLHIKKQPWYARPVIRSFQSLLRNTTVGKVFYSAVATKESVKGILCKCYHDKSAVTDELVQMILQPGLEPGAADVFLEFICYSEGPLPEELLPKVKCPVLVAWGDKDPWEPIELGKAYADFDAVEDFVILPGVGHCPQIMQDEAPDLVNPLIESFVNRHSHVNVSG